MKSYMAKNGELTAKWHVVDATDKVLGRMAVKIATILMGKHRPEYTPHVDTGEFVIVTNAANVRITGTNKPTQRVYQRYSRYPGGQKEITFEKMMQMKPEVVITNAVRRMLPKNSLGASMLTKLKVYAGSDHPHQAQLPEVLEL